MIAKKNIRRKSGNTSYIVAVFPFAFRIPSRSIDRYEIFGFAAGKIPSKVNDGVECRPRCKREHCDVYNVGRPLIRHFLFSPLLEVLVTNLAAQLLQYQPSSRWNISKILYKILQMMGRPTV